MADETIIDIVELDIDQEKVLKKLTELTEEIKENRTETKKLETVNKELTTQGKKGTAQYKENATQIEKNKTNVKNLSTEYRTNQTALAALAAGESKELGTLESLALQNKKLSAEKKKLNLRTEEGKKRLKEINTQLDKNNKFSRDNADALTKQKINVGNYEGALQGLPGPLGRIVMGFKSMTKAALAFIATPIGIVIAAIGAAIGALTSYFKRSEEGQNALTKVVKVFGSILDNIMDVIDSVGKALWNAVTKPKEAWENFKDRVQEIGEFFQNTFGNLIGGNIEVFVANFQKGFAMVGLAWQKFKDLFVDNTEGINESQAKIELANDKITEGQARMRKGAEYMVEAYTKARNKIKGFYDEIKNDAAISKKLADEEANLRMQERKDIVENAKLSTKSAQLRAEAETLKLTNAEKSIELFSKSFDLDEKIIESELKIAQRKAENAKLAATLASSDIETLDNIAKLEADVENKRKAFEETRRQRTRRLNAIRLEAFKQEKERLNSQLELSKIAADETIRANERIIDNEKSTQDEVLKAFEQNTLLKTELLAKESEIELAEINSRLELMLISQEDFELQKELITKKYADNALILFEENIDNKIESEKKFSEIDKQLAEAKYKVAADLAGAMMALFNENTIAAKFAAIAQTVINTYAGAMAAFTGTPGGIVIKSLAAAAAVGMGIANLRKIMAVNPKGSSGSITSVTGNVMSGAPVRDGGTAARSGSSLLPSQLKDAVRQGMIEAPSRNVLVIERVTERQNTQTLVEEMSTV